MTKTFISFSGGLDSTYGLWKVLTETQDTVTAFAINTDDMTQPERTKYDVRSFYGVDNQRVTQAAAWLKTNVRDFTLIIHPFDPAYAVRGYGNVNSPMPYMTRYAVPRVNSGEYDKIVFCAEKENDGFANGGTVAVRRTGSIPAKEIFLSDATRGSINFPLIDADYTQANSLAELPPDLLKIVNIYSPDNPVFKSKKIGWFMDRLNEGKTTAEIYDLWYQNCTVVPGKYFTMKYWIEGTSPTDQNVWDMPEWPSSYIVPQSPDNSGNT